MARNVLGNDVAQAFLLGGERGENFVITFYRLKANLEAKGFDVHAVYGGYHGLIPGALPANESNVNQLLSDAIIAAQKGNVGKRIIFYIEGHGDTEGPAIRGGTSSENVEFYKHRIWLTNDLSFSTERLIPLLKACQTTSTQCLIIDQSCEGAITTKLVERYPRACGISASSPSAASLSSRVDPDRSVKFDAALVSTLQTVDTINAEELFRRARLADTTSSNFPQISSLVTPGFEDFDSLLGGSDPASAARQWRIFSEGGGCLFCVTVDPETSLLKAVGRIEQTIGAEMDQELVTKHDEMRSLIDVYFDLYRDFERFVIRSNPVLKTFHSETAVNSGSESNPSVGLAKQLLKEYHAKQAQFEKVSNAIFAIERLYYEKYQQTHPRKNAACSDFMMNAVR